MCLFRAVRYCRDITVVLDRDLCPYPVSSHQDYYPFRSGFTCAGRTRDTHEVSRRGLQVVEIRKTLSLSQRFASCPDCSAIFATAWLNDRYYYRETYLDLQFGITLNRHVFDILEVTLINPLRETYLQLLMFTNRHICSNVICFVSSNLIVEKDTYC